MIAGSDHIRVNCSSKPSLPLALVDVMAAILVRPWGEKRTIKSHLEGWT